MSRIEEMEQLARISKLGPIARRYFAMNAFDGTLTILGIILASHFAGHFEARAIVAAGIGACLAMMFSGLAGTYLAEKAERERELREMEQAMLRNLDQTLYKRATRFAIIISSVVDGFAPFMAGMLLLVPFFYVIFNPVFWGNAVIVSVITGFALLFLLGIFLGRVSEQNQWFYGLQTLAAGLGTAVAIILLEIFLTI
ncbi:MAG: VIT1/CCC1 transporter family protein [Candidatus Hermodarchaeia archaeon]|jgi:predicted membrane protein (TIGR00267 family)